MREYQRLTSPCGRAQSNSTSAGILALAIWPLLMLGQFGGRGLSLITLSIPRSVSSLGILGSWTGVGWVWATSPASFCRLRHADTVVHLPHVVPIGLTPTEQ